MSHSDFRSTKPRIDGDGIQLCPGDAPHDVNLDNRPGETVQIEMAAVIGTATEFLPWPLDDGGGILSRDFYFS